MIAIAFRISSGDLPGPLSSLRPFLRAAPLLVGCLVAGACMGADASRGEVGGRAEETAEETPGSSAEEDTDEIAPAARPDPEGVAAPRPDEQPSDTRRAAPLPDPVEIPEAGERPRFQRPEHVRGLYLNAWTAGSSGRLERFIRLARETEINTFVIDIKDATGHVSHATGVPMAREIGALGEIRIRDLPGLLRRLEEEGIWPVARIVIVKDPFVARAHPDMAIQDSAGGPWADGQGVRWLNLFDERVRRYHMDLAREVVELGFPEIQWDYVRFPDAPREELARAVYPGRDGRRRPDAVRLFLEESREALAELDALVTADVFGVTTSAHDVGIGQIWQEFIDVVDAALPMIYPSHYWRGSFGIEAPNAHPYEIVVEALERAVERSSRVEGAGRTIPYLQDFSMGEPDYGAPEVRAQIQAAYDVGIDEWVLWNAGSRYTEEALEPAGGWREEPVGGWREEPLIRVAGRLVPVGERYEALRLAELEAETRRVTPVPALEMEEEPDSLRVRRDSIGR